MNKMTVISALFAAASLSACGGGGDGGVPAPAAAGAPAPAPAGAPAPAPSASPVTGSVSAPFKAASKVAAFTARIGVSSQGPLAAGFVQEASGAVTNVQSFALSGTTAVRDVSGNASFAMGRWAAGTVTDSSSGVVLTEAGNNSQHYLVLNNPPALPASGAPACDAGTFTTPSWDGSGPLSQDHLAASTGSATLAFASGKATLAATIQTHNSSSSGTGSFSVQVTSPANVSFSGRSLGLGETGAFLTLGDGGDGSYLIGGSYTVKLANGAGYFGVFKFRCQ